LKNNGRELFIIRSKEDTTVNRIYPEFRYYFDEDSILARKYFLPSPVDHKEEKISDKYIETKIILKQKDNIHLPVVRFRSFE
jgi:hypothetical protein